MAKRDRGSTTTDSPVAVVGLDEGRRKAQRQHRTKRLKSRASSFIVGALLVGAIGGTAYAVYEMWLAEEGWGKNGGDQVVTYDELDQLIDDLGRQPRWNGPGNPTFGIGDDQDPPLGLEQP